VRDDKRQEEARQALERVARDSETIGTSSLNRVGRRVADHFGANDALREAEGQTDPIELWGRRIGRALSLIGVVVLAYLLGAQLRFW
jgi:hypothetical protein